MAQVVQLAEFASEPVTQTLPQNVEAEAALLGALMVDNRLVEDIQLKLKPHHFFEPLHGRIYEAILKMTDGNRVANPVTLRPLFESDENIKEVGGVAYLAQLTGSGAAVIGARDFAEQIYDLALLRALIGVGRDLVEGALDTSEDVAPLAQIERAESALYSVAEEGGAEGKAKSFSDATKEALEVAERALNSGGHLSGFTTGLDSLNAKIGGLHKSDLMIVAGRPGMGKSSLGTNIAFAAAQRFIRDAEDGIEPEKSAGAPVALFSLEMSADQLATRILAEESGSAPRICAWARSASRNSASSRARRPTCRACRSTSTIRRASPLPLFAPAPAVSSGRRASASIVVDYLQLLQGTGRKRSENRVQEISEISRGLKQLAKELNVPVIGLSQLSRAVEQREDKRPQLSDLREFGLDRAGRRHRALHLPRGLLSRREAAGRRPSATSPAWQEEMARAYGKAEVIVAKQRHGATGKVRLKFDGRITKFSDPADEGYLPEMRG